MTSQVEAMHRLSHSKTLLEGSKYALDNNRLSEAVSMIHEAVLSSFTSLLLLEGKNSKYRRITPLFEGTFYLSESQKGVIVSMVPTFDTRLFDEFYRKSSETRSTLNHESIMYLYYVAEEVHMVIRDHLIPSYLASSKVI